MYGDTKNRGCQISYDTGDSANDLSVKLSPCMCSYSSCPGWRNDWNMYQTFISVPGTDMHYDCVYMHSMSFHLTFFFNHF